MSEEWDKDLELNIGLEEGQHSEKIIGIQSFTSANGRKGIKVIFPNNYVLNTTAQNMIEFLRDHKPVIGKTLSWIQKGVQLARRFEDIRIK